MSSESPPESDLIAVLKKAVTESGQSVNQIAKASGVSQSSLSRFMAGGRMLSLEAAAKLFEYLGLQAVMPRVTQEQPEPSPPPAKKKPKK